MELDIEYLEYQNMLRERNKLENDYYNADDKYEKRNVFEKLQEKQREIDLYINEIR